MAISRFVWVGQLRRRLLGSRQSVRTVDFNRRVSLRATYLIEEGKLGGPQVQMVKVAAAISKLGGADVDLIIPSANSEAFQSLCQRDGVRFSTLPITRLTRSLWPMMQFALFWPFELLAMARRVKQDKAAIIHSWGGSWQWKAVALSRITGVPVVWLLNDTMMPSYIRRIFGVVSRHCDGFIFASHRSADYYAPIILRKVPSKVIQSAVDSVDFDPAQSYQGDEEFIASLGDAFVVGMIGNVSPVKGIETFIRVAARAKSLAREIKFVVIGRVFQRQQSYHARLRDLATELGADNVIFAGGRDDVRPLLKRMDVYLCSSNSESSPVAVWEAMMMGLPILSTKVGDVPRFVGDGEAGLLADVEDDATLFQHLERIVQDGHARQVMGTRAREVAIANFDSETIAAETLDFYRQIVGGRD